VRRSPTCVTRPADSSTAAARRGVRDRHSYRIERTNRSAYTFKAGLYAASVTVLMHAGDLHPPAIQLDHEEHQRANHPGARERRDGEGIGRGDRTPAWLNTPNPTIHVRTRAIAGRSTRGAGDA
jgi:hypothetical protein